MIRITSNFDSRKFVRDLERKVHEAAERKVRSKFQDLIAKGLRIKHGSDHIGLEGPTELIEEAKRRLR